MDHQIHGVWQPPTHTTDSSKDPLTEASVLFFPVWNESRKLCCPNWQRGMRRWVDDKLISFALKIDAKYGENLETECGKLVWETEWIPDLFILLVYNKLNGTGTRIEIY